MTPRRIWTLRTNGPVEGAPARCGARFACASYDGVVRVASYKTGRPSFSVDADGPIHAGPLVVGGRLFVARHSRGKRAHGEAIAIDVRRRAIVWRRELRGIARAAPVAVGGLVVWASWGPARRGVVEALDAATGAPRWRVERDGFFDHAPLVVGDALVAGDLNGGLCAMGRDGVVRWETPLGAMVRSSPIAVDAGTAVVALHDGRVAAFDVRTGRRRWDVHVDGPAGTPLVDGDTLWFGSWDGHLYGVDRATRTTRVIVDVGVEVQGAPARIGDDIAFGAEDGVLRAIDRRSGRLSWTFATEGGPVRGRILGAPLCVGAHVVVGAADGNVYGLELR